jgi:DNA-binding MarR family transcriptional regulator
MFHHEFIRLEGLGLLERHNLHGGSRTTHLKLTAEGERLARELLGEDAATGSGTLKLEDLEFLPIEWPLADGSF